MAMQLYQLISQYRELQELDSDDIPEEVLRDTLEGLEGELTVKATNIAFYAQNLESFADSAQEAAKAMKARADRIRRRAESIKAYLKSMMEAAQITKIESPEFTLAIKKNPPAVVIVPDVKLPDELMVKPPAPEPYPNRKLIGEKLKAGEVIEGCRLEQGTRLEVRT